MKRITQKMLTEFIAKVADKKPSNILDDNAMCYYSKIDGAYFTLEGMEKEGFKFLLKYGITEQLQNTENKSDCTVNIGFNPQEQKWYGWSHRALYGFIIGSTCKKGDCHYQPANKKDFLEDCIRFWDDENHINTDGIEATENKILGVRVTWKYNDKIPNEKLRGTIGGMFCEYPSKWGKGEWIAKTMEDAKQMAVDFANEVS